MAVLLQRGKPSRIIPIHGGLFSHNVHVANRRLSPIIHPQLNTDVSFGFERDERGIFDRDFERCSMSAYGKNRLGLSKKPMQIIQLMDKRQNNTSALI